MISDIGLLKLAQCELNRADVVDACSRLELVNAELDGLELQKDPSNPEERQAGATKTILLPGNVPMVFCWCPATTSKYWKQMSGGRDWFELGGIYPFCKRGGTTNRLDVTLTRGFWIAKTEVTQRQYGAVMKLDNICHDEVECPVYYDVSWSNCVEFCKRVNSILKDGMIMSLPSEAQWVYACKAGTNAFAQIEIDSMAWHRGNSGKDLHPVGQKKPNAWGIYDMLGNAQEYCSDTLYADVWPSGVTCLVDPKGIVLFDQYDTLQQNEKWSKVEIEYMARSKAVRGGCYLTDTVDCNENWTSNIDIDEKKPFAGFRPIITCSQFSSSLTP